MTLQRPAGHNSTDRDRALLPVFELYTLEILGLLKIIVISLFPVDYKKKKKNPQSELTMRVASLGERDRVAGDHYRCCAWLSPASLSSPCLAEFPDSPFALGLHLTRCCRGSLQSSRTARVKRANLAPPHPRSCHGFLGKASFPHLKKNLARGSKGSQETSRGLRLVPGLSQAFANSSAIIMS